MGGPGGGPPGATGFTFSPDSRHFAYVGLSRGGMEPTEVVVRDHQLGRPYSQISKFTFSADSKHLAYATTTPQRKQIVVIDEQESREYDKIIQGGPTFNPDGSLEYLAVRDGALFRIRVTP
jgi:hypothetical protein